MPATSTASRWSSRAPATSATRRRGAIQQDGGVRMCVRPLCMRARLGYLCAARRVGALIVRPLCTRRNWPRLPRNRGAYCGGPATPVLRWPAPPSVQNVQFCTRPQIAHYEMWRKSS
mgnify:CR=1 FL=1